MNISIDIFDHVKSVNMDMDMENFMSTASLEIPL